MDFINDNNEKKKNKNKWRAQCAIPKIVNCLRVVEAHLWYIIRLASLRNCSSILPTWLSSAVLIIMVWNSLLSSFWIIFITWVLWAISSMVSSTVNTTNGKLIKIIGQVTLRNGGAIDFCVMFYVLRFLMDTISAWTSNSVLNFHRICTCALEYLFIPSYVSRRGLSCFVCLFSCLFCFETGCHYLNHAGLSVTVIPLPLSPHTTAPDLWVL